MVLVQTTLGRVLLFFYAHVGIVIAGMLIPCLTVHSPGITANSISHAVIHAIKISKKKEGRECFIIYSLTFSASSCIRLRIFFDKHPILLFLILYFSLLFFGSGILSLTVDITLDDIQKGDSFEIIGSNRTMWVCTSPPHILNDN